MVAKRFVSTILASSSSGVRFKSVVCEIPAQLTRTSSGPTAAAAYYASISTLQDDIYVKTHASPQQINLLENHDPQKYPLCSLYPQHLV